MWGIGGVPVGYRCLSEVDVPGAPGCASSPDASWASWSSLISETTLLWMVDGIVSHTGGWESTIEHACDGTEEGKGIASVEDRTFGVKEAGDRRYGWSCSIRATRFAPLKWGIEDGELTSEIEEGESGESGISPSSRSSSRMEFAVGRNPLKDTRDNFEGPLGDWWDDSLGIWGDSWEGARRLACMNEVGEGIPESWSIGWSNNVLRVSGGARFVF